MHSTTPEKSTNQLAVWRDLLDSLDVIRDFVHRGGRYLGFCLGAYLAGATPGFRLLPGDTDQYITSAGTSVRSESDTVVQVTWRAQIRHMYFQDAPNFRLKPKAKCFGVGADDSDHSRRAGGEMG